MTARDLLDLAGANPLPIAGVLGAEVLVSFGLGFVHGPGRGGATPWRYVYSVLVYLACVPGVFAALLTAYAIFFTHQNLLDVNALVYFGPIAAMGVTLGLIRRNVSFDEIPGFDRLSGLMTLLAVTFGSLFVLSRVFFGVVFFGSIATLIALGVFVFSLLKWGAAMAFRKQGAPKMPPPSFGL